MEQCIQRVFRNVQCIAMGNKDSVLSDPSLSLGISMPSSMHIPLIAGWLVLWGHDSGGGLLKEAVSVLMQQHLIT